MFCRGKSQLNLAQSCKAEKLQELCCRKQRVEGTEVVMKHMHDGDIRLKQITCMDLSRVSPSRHLALSEERQFRAGPNTEFHIPRELY